MEKITREAFEKVVEDYKEKGLLEANGGYILMGCNICLSYSEFNSQGRPFKHVDVMGIIPCEITEGFINMTKENPEATTTNIIIVSNNTIRKFFPDGDSKNELAPNSFASMCSEEQVDQKSLSKTYGSAYIQALPIYSEAILRLFLNTTLAYYADKSREVSKTYTKE